MQRMPLIFARARHGPAVESGFPKKILRFLVAANAALHCMVTRGIVQRWVDRLVDLPPAYPVSAVVTGSTGPENSEGPYFFMCPCTAGPGRRCGRRGHKPSREDNADTRHKPAALSALARGVCVRDEYAVVQHCRTKRHKKCECLGVPRAYTRWGGGGPGPGGKVCGW